MHLQFYLNIAPSVAGYRDAFTENTNCIVVFEPVVEAFVGAGLRKRRGLSVVLTKRSQDCYPCVVPGELPSELQCLHL